MADEEAFAVVVGIDEPAGDVVGGAAADLLGRWVVHVQPADLDFDLIRGVAGSFGAAGFGGADVHVGLAEYHEQIARARLL